MSLTSLKLTIESRTDQHTTLPTAEVFYLPLTTADPTPWLDLLKTLLLYIVEHPELLIAILTLILKPQPTPTPASEGH